MAWYSKTENLILESMQLGRPATDKARIASATKAIGYYTDKDGYQKTDLTQAYTEQFKDAETWKRIPKTTYNLVKPVCNTLGKLYAHPVIRTFPDKKDQDEFAAIKGYNPMMKHVDILTNVSGTVAVRPVWNGERQAIEYAIYYGDEIDVTPDPVNPARPMQVRLSWRFGGTRIEHIWEADRFVELVDDVVTTPEAEQAHGYGRIPLVFFTNDLMFKRILDEPANDLVQGNLTLNWLMTIINDCIPLQMAGLLVTKGKPPDLNIRVGQRAHLGLPAETDADAKYIYPGADIDKGLAAVNLNLELFFSQRNIPESAIRATQLSGKSGVAFVAEQASLVEYQNDRQVVFGPKDAELAALSLAVMRYHKTKKFEMPEPPSIKYQEQRMPMSADERADWDWQYQIGAATPLDYIMAREPGLSREDAQKRIEENMKYKYRQFQPAIEDKDLIV